MDAEDYEGYTVGLVAELTGVSVRTLHHYDQIGVLQPGHRNAAGYRPYLPQDLQRLQRILFYRELGFGLDTISVILADPESTDSDHLQRQRQLLAARIARCQAMMAVIDKELSARKMGISLTPQERLEVSTADMRPTASSPRYTGLTSGSGGTTTIWPPGLSQYIHDAIIANCQRAADSHWLPPAAAPP